MYATFNAWKEKFKANIVDMGGKLKPGGKVLTASEVMDGPLVETKEVIGGYMVIAAESYELAAEVVRDAPDCFPDRPSRFARCRAPDDGGPRRALFPARPCSAGGDARAPGRRATSRTRGRRRPIGADSRAHGLGGAGSARKPGRLAASSRIQQAGAGAARELGPSEDPARRSRRSCRAAP